MPRSAVIRLRGDAGQVARGVDAEALLGDRQRERGQAGGGQGGRRGRLGGSVGTLGAGGLDWVGGLACCLVVTVGGRRW